MSKTLTISPSEAADRLAIPELIEAYAHCADRRDAKSQMVLFTADSHFVAYMSAKDPKPSRARDLREALANHVTAEGGNGRSMLASLRCFATFVEIDGAWLFAERLLYVDWVEERAPS